MALEEYEQIIQEAADAFQVDPELIRRMIRQESAGNPAAESIKGASGLMQLMPDTARSLGVKNILDPRENITGGTRYISQLLKQYRGDTERALAAYNAGPGNVARYGGIPPFDETRNYVQRILNGYQPPTQGISAEAAVVPGPQNPISTPSPSPSPSPSPETLSLMPQTTMPQNTPQTYQFRVRDPQSGETYIFRGDSPEPPTDEEIEEFVADFKTKNPQVPSTRSEDDPAGDDDPNVIDPESFKGRVLQQSEAAQVAQDPKAFLSGLVDTVKGGIGRWGLNPQAILGEMAATGVVDELKRSVGRFNTELDRVPPEQSGDLVERGGRVGSAVAAGIPIFGEMVQPLREDIPIDPNQPVNLPGVAGTLVGTGVDAALARFMPPVAGKTIGATGSGITGTGQALSRNASNRLLENAKAGPITAREIANDVLPWRSARGALTLGASLISPHLAGLMGAGVGAVEAGKMASRSSRLARLQGRVGNFMDLERMPEMQGPQPQWPDVLPPVEELWAKAEEINPALVTDPLEHHLYDRQTDDFDLTPEQIEAQGGVIRVEPPADILPDLDELWAKSGIEDKPVGLQSLDEPVRTGPLPEIKGKEGKRLYGEDQNRVSKRGRSDIDEDEISLDDLDDIDIDLDEPEIVVRGGKLVDTKVETPPKKVEVDPNAPVIPFADIESGSRVRTANGKEGIVEAFDDKSVTVKWDSGTRSRIARKAVKKVEVKKAGPKVDEEDIDLEDLDEPGVPIKLKTSSKMIDASPIPEGQFRVNLYDDVPDSGWVKLRASENHPKLAKVDDIFLTEYERGKGYATGMYEKALAKAQDKGFEGIISEPGARNANSNRIWEKLKKTHSVEELPDGSLILRDKKEPLKLANKFKETDLERAAREASESLDEPVGDDPFGVEPKRKASGAVKKIEPQLPKAKAGLKSYSVSGEPTPRSNLTNPRMVGDNPRALGLNDRAIRSSKVGWEIDDAKIKDSLSKGTAHVQVNIDELVKAAKEDIARPGRAGQKVGKTDKLTRAKHFLQSTQKDPTKIFTPEIEIKNGKVVIADGYHRIAAARHLGELSVPVRIPLSQIGQLESLGVKHRKLY